MHQPHSLSSFSHRPSIHPMVFGLPFFSSEKQQQQEDAATSPDIGDVISECIPEPALKLYPGLALAPYNPGQPHRCANMVALVHNACRLEIAEMTCDVLPALVSRVGKGLNMQDAAALDQWWTGFARFMLTSSMVDRMIVDLAFKNITRNSTDELARDIRTLRARFNEKNNSALEERSKSMGLAVTKFVQAVDESTLQAVKKCWEQLAALLVAIYTLVEGLTKKIEKWSEKVIPHQDLHKQITKMYKDRSQSSINASSSYAEMMVMLNRWIENEEIMKHNLVKMVPKNDRSFIDDWLDAFKKNRFHLVMSFHHRFLL